MSPAPGISRSMTNFGMYARPGSPKGLRYARSSRAEIEGGDRFAIANVECGARQGRRRPREVLQDRRAGQHFHAGRRQGDEAEIPVFVEQDRFAVGVEELRAREAAVLPHDLAALHVDRAQERWAEIAAR